MKKEFGKYFLGLDMGTNSVGWAVTDEEYHLQKFNRKHMWGIHLFEGGKTAAERRTARTARRRRDRQVQRLKLLQELFSEEITKVDPGFFLRLKDSFFQKEDKSEIQPNTLFNDKNYTDKDFHKEYPTIYHLRLAFIQGKPITDPRLLYLAIAHIIKNRGHFLFEGLNPDNIGNSFQDLLFKMAENLEQGLDMPINIDNPQMIHNILMDENIKSSEKIKKLLELFQTIETDSVKLKEILQLLTGGKASLGKIINDANLDDSKYKTFSLADLNDDEVPAGEESLADILQDRTAAIESVKAVFDWLKLSDILNGMNNLSEAKVSVYNKHKNDLKRLKSTIKKFAPEQYNDIFISPNKENNYPAYVRLSKKNGKKQIITSQSCSQADFCKFINNLVVSFPEYDDNVQYILKETSDGKFLPRQKSNDNSVIPYQLNEKDLKSILYNASKNFPFLESKDEDGYSVREKIMLLLTFNIPYYIGPLNDAHKNTTGHCWIVKKDTGKVRPWNFDRIVDKEESAKEFIKRMTNKCTYLVGEDVLPKNSLIYTKYMVLDELNNLKLDGLPITVDTKQKIYQDLFLKHYHVTETRLRNYLISEGIIKRDTEISGIDGDFKASLKSWLDFSHILDRNQWDESLIEEIIETITLFSGTDILISRLKNICSGKISEEQIKKIAKLKYKDWGRFSRKFLTEIYQVDKQTGECHSFIDMLELTNCNHMELLSSKYDFMDKIRKHNLEINGLDRDINYDRVKELYVSPAVRRTIWRTMCIVKEIRKIMGHDPEKIFIEVPREEGEKKRTVSRKKQIEKLYKSCKDITPELKELLKVKDENDLRSDRLFLYFIQKGKCMYSKENISLDQLFDTNIYDIDHIYPRSLTKDDSILNNKVLCLKTINKNKDQDYPIKPEIQQKMADFWLTLKKQNLITSEKYNRLTRRTELTYDDLSSFISRQIVETGQACKAAAEILRQVFPNSIIVYSKPGNVDQFRQQYDLIKVRDLNDLHHAKDAYLNIVVGNIFDTKFTRDPRNFFKQKDHHYNLEKIFNYDISRNGYIAWQAPCENGAGTLEIVKNTYNRNDVLFTRYSYSRSGKYFKTTPLPKGKWQYPLKTSDPRYLKTNNEGNLIYGGYTEVSGAYAFLVEHYKKGQKVRTIEFVPIYYKDRIETGQATLLQFAEEILQLKSPKILINRIRFDSLLILDGFPIHLTGRTGEYILGKNAAQLHLPENTVRYYKKIEKFFNDQKENKKLLVSKKSGISSEENLILYQQLKNKFKTKPYSDRKDLYEKYTLLETGKDKFISLSLEDQCIVLYRIVSLFHCISLSNIYLSDIGGKNTMKIYWYKDVLRYKTAYLINQSVTGLFEEKINLQTI